MSSTTRPINITPCVDEQGVIHYLWRYTEMREHTLEMKWSVNPETNKLEATWLVIDHTEDKPQANLPYTTRTK